MIKYIHRKRLWEKYIPGVRKLLFDADREFYPPLSARNSTTQTLLKHSNQDKDNDNGEAAESDAPNSADKTDKSHIMNSTGQAAIPEEYFRTMSRQNIVMAIEGETVAGFMSYKPAYELDIKGKKIICSYVSTIVVSPQYRGKGITSEMYKKLFEETGDAFVATRTWSKNSAHIHILKKMGFRLLMTLKDDRGPGIDTVYYGKEIANG
ncbi:MAG: GNAT family N-acetyltransferase [Lachnospiraceae bacterium]|nr:GNAT family N-acetyltransferase [Lachnospiraceae bacterium]